MVLQSDKKSQSPTGEVQDSDGFRDVAPFSAEVGGDRLTFYPGGQDRLARLLELIGQAQRSIHMFYYLFLADEDGETVRDALVAAARRGVAVELMVDSFGSSPDAEFFAPITEAGGCFDIFLARRSVRYLVRNHQKIAIFDEQRAMVGGFNISTHYFSGPQFNGWNDLGLEVEGSAVAQLLRWYGQLADWIHDPKAQFSAVRQLVRGWRPDDGPVQLLIGGPTRVPSSWAMRVKRDIAHARRLDLVMAYFSPPRSYRRLIGRVAGRGRARLVMAGKSDNTTTIGAARALYRKLLMAGAQIFEFEGCKMHTKLVVVDDATYVGSSNFDMRSLRLNLELMLRIDDAPLAAKMHEFIDHYEPHSREVTLADDKRERTWWNRLRWWASWGIVSVLDYTITRRLNIPL